MPETLNVLLGVTGSVAAYRAADLARTLMRAGADVRVCLTRSAAQFVTPHLFEALTGNPVLIDTFEEPERGRMAHIDWARWANVMVIAPASANTLGKLANGVGDNMLTTVALASKTPLVIAPAMNPQMYASDATQAALRLLTDRGAEVVEPSEGDVACGEYGQGKLASIEAISDSVLEVGKLGRILVGKRVCITSGPTQEPIDTVRFLSNRSSGKMGSALARTALLMGAEVIVVAGPSTVSYPLGAELRRVRTAEEMLAATLEAGQGCDLIIGAAAVADFRPAHPAATKIRKDDQLLSLQLVQNPDVIAQVAQRFGSAKVVAFAAEPSDDLTAARMKLSNKGLFAIAANDVSNPEIGFDAGVNELRLVFADGPVLESGRRSKLGCAIWMLQRLSADL